MSGARLELVRPLALAIVLPAVACASSGPLDVVPESHHVGANGAGSTAQGSYAHVAKRSMGFVASSNERGIDPEEAARAVERLADSLDGCAARLAQGGKLVDGAIRVAAKVRADGSIATSRVTIAPGDAVAANALLCVLAPLKLMTMSAGPESDAGARGFVIDASWGPATR